MVTSVAFVGGWAHPAEQTGPALAEALGAVGVVGHVVAGFAAAVAAMDAHAPDLLVVHTCRFQMLDARYTPAQRAEFAELTPPAWRAAVLAHLAAGRPMLGLHTAPISFDDWEQWPALLGATWHWDRSNHPPPGPFTVDVVGGEPFTVVDELYRFVTPADGARVVATAVDAEGTVHPQAWLHDAPGPSSARVAYSALGHDARSLGDAAHRALLSRIVTWLTTEGDAWPT